MTKRVVRRIFYREIPEDPYFLTTVLNIRRTGKCRSEAERDEWKADENGF